MFFISPPSLRCSAAFLRNPIADQLCPLILRHFRNVGLISHFALTSLCLITSRISFFLNSPHLPPRSIPKPISHSTALSLLSLLLLPNPLPEPKPKPKPRSITPLTPLTNKNSVVREINRINERELALTGGAAASGGTTASWHDDYKGEFFLYVCEKRRRVRQRQDDGFSAE